MITSAQYSDAETTKDNKSNGNNYNSSTMKITIVTNTRILFSKLFLKVVVQPKSSVNQGVIYEYVLGTSSLECDWTNTYSLNLKNNDYWQFLIIVVKLPTAK